MLEPKLNPVEQARYDRRDDEFGPVISRLICWKHGVVGENRQKSGADTVWHEVQADHLIDGCGRAMGLETINA